MKYIIILALLLTGCSSGGGSSNTTQETKTSATQKLCQPLYSLDLKGHGADNGLQDFAFGDYLYTTHETDGITTINVFDEYGRYIRHYVDDMAGHQGLSYYYGLWTTGKDKRTAVNEGNTFVLFGDGFKSTTSASPTVSKDGQYVIAYGKYKGAETAVIRVWHYAVFTESGDYSELYINEFPTDAIDYDHPGQGLVSDGESIYIVSGNWMAEEDKRLIQYDLDGNELSRRSVTIGKTDSGTYEPEGLGYKDGELLIGIRTGKKGERSSKIYSLEDC